MLVEARLERKHEERERCLGVWQPHASTALVLWPSRHPYGSLDLLGPAPITATFAVSKPPTSPLLHFS